ncbi:MAG: Fic family protein [Gemmatimonadales bacterium]
MYIWERPQWPDFTWETDRLLEPLAATRRKQGLLLGTLARLGFDLKGEAELGALTESAVMSAAIEGETLNRASVRSSLARRLGIADAATAPSDRRVDGMVDLLLDATRHHDRQLTAERLFHWHTLLFPAVGRRSRPVSIGAWRTDANGPMQVVSGPMGRERVHFQAPPAERVPTEMRRFLDWFAQRSKPEGLLRAGVAHLWFVTIHPFDDGNGRIARAVADLALAQSDGVPERFYAMSSQIRKERADYYDLLEQTQRGDLDVTDWLVWFLGCLGRAIEGALAESDGVLTRGGFWQRHAGEPFTARQRLVLNRALDGFEGTLTARKWAALAKCSIASALRDINDLLDRGILVKNPGGSRSTSYRLAAPG